MNVNKQWVFFTLLTSFSIYWTANLVLWFPWSYSATLGMTLMLTVAPLLWSVGIFQCLKTYEGKLLQGALITSIIYIFIAVIADYIFFGIIREAMEELYHPTTFYGYLFLLSLPFVLSYLFPKQLNQKSEISKKDLYRYIALGAFSFLSLVLIIEFDVVIPVHNTV